MSKLESIDICTIFGFWPKRNVDCSVETLLRIKKRCNVDKVVALSARGIFYDFVQGNDETLAVAERYKDDIIPAMTVNLAQYFDCYVEIERCIEKGFKILRLFPTYQEWDITQAPFRKLIRILRNKYLPIILPADMGITTIGDIAGELPSPVIIEGFRYCNLSEMIIVMQERENIYAETHLINSPDGIEILIKEVGPERVVFGSNFPVHYMASGVLPVKNAKLDSSIKQKVLGENIKRVLRLAR